VLDLQADCHLSPAPRSPRRWGLIGLLAAFLSLGLVGLRAAGNETAAATPDAPDAALAPDAADASLPEAIEDASVEEMLPAEVLADDGKSEPGNEGEGAFATFPVPSFADLAGIPKDKDFLAAAVLRDGRLVVEGANPKVLTVDPSLQKKLTDLLKTYEVPYGAIAAVEPSTGRVLALAEHSHDAPAVRGLPVKAVYPAASVFKIVTGAALLAAGTPPYESVCFHGGKRKIEPKLLEDGKADYRCATFAQAMGYSFNVVFGKLAKKKLDTKALKGWAQKFGFNEPIPFAEPADVSVARIPDDGFGMAKAAAGFGEVFLSPLHGALLAAAVGNKGVMMSPLLFEGESPQSRRVLEEPLAAQLSEMMELTVTDGTARRAFRERGRYVLGENRAAGKTGSLSDKKPFRDFSWFVGWAPKESPKIAVAAVVVNGPYWRVHSTYLAREAMRIWLEPPKTPKAPRKSVAKK
jgi:penicillin-binding protein A